MPRFEATGWVPSWPEPSATKSEPHHAELLATSHVHT